MSITEKLLFFNKQGYPYNFTLTDNVWNGKILFEPNSSDTFEDLSMYILEKVEPISLTDNIKIVNDELYNVSGMTITPYTYSDFKVENILPVNKSDRFYSKWIYGKGIEKKFPLSTIVSFSGSINTDNLLYPSGHTDFTSDRLYSVVATKKNAIMIITDTDNNSFNLHEDELHSADFSNLKISSIRTVSFPEYNRNLESEYRPNNDMKISIVGTQNNDGVYELSNINHNYSSIYDYDLSSLPSDTTSIEVDVELLTDRPLLYYGNINIYKDGDTLLAKFLDKRNVSLNIGTTFIVEDNIGNHQFNSNEYTITSFIDKINLGTSKVFINSVSEIDDDGKRYNFTEIIYNSNDINIEEQDDIYLNYINDTTLDFSGFYDYGLESINIITDISGDTISFDTTRIFETGQIINIMSGSTTTVKGTYKIKTGGKNKIFDIEVISGSTSITKNDIVTYTNTLKNDNIKFKILSIEDAYVTKGINTIPVIINNTQFKKAKIDINLLNYGSFNYTFTKVLKDNEKNIAVVSASVDDEPYNSSSALRCLSVSNILKLNHQYINSVSETIDTFINKYKNYLKSNGIDLYKLNNKLILESLYYGQKYYFNSKLLVNGIEQYSNKLYSNSENITTVYNLILKENDLTYEKTNMSNVTTKTFYANLKLSLSDDVKDYGFSLNINDIDYYIEYNDSTDLLSNTSVTIDSFIEKWYDVFDKNGLIIYKGNEQDNTLEQLFIIGKEPNVKVENIKVKVNKFSSYKFLDVNNEDNNTVKNGLINIIYNSYTMLTSNYLEISSINLIDYGFSTGMIISLYGSTYPSNNKEFNIIGITNSRIELSFQGNMYNDEKEITLISREYLRRPRETNLKDIYYRFRWEDDLSSEIFMFDLSGENLKPWMNHPDYVYTGPKPLPLNGDIVFLNKEPNKDINFVNIPNAQQTIFDQLDFRLEKFDEDYVSILPKPITVSFGYNTVEEGVNNRTLIMERDDNVSLSGLADGTTLYFTITGNKIKVEGTNNNINLLDIGFEVGKTIRFKLTDKFEYSTNIFEDWQDFIITDVTVKTLTFNTEMKSFSTKNLEFDYTFEQLPTRIGLFTFYGETETEDERLKSLLNIHGINLNDTDEYIFNESNIKEQGIDYKLLNRKRKEMMLVYPQIYNYIGTYTALFNAINFFGYNDLELYEYYRNVDLNSPLFNSIKRVIVQDLFDKNIEGWTYSEDLSKRIGYKKTNLLNLTYKITDEEGNNINLYSLSDVQIKLNGLKNWLRENVIPLNMNIRDITGVSQNSNIMWRQFDPSNNIFKHKTKVSTETINFNYIASKNFNDSWLVSVRFYNVNGFVPEYFDLKVITYTKDSNNMLIPQTNYNIYKTDMLPFNFYLNWTDGISDKYMFVETTYYNTDGVGRKINKMYGLEDGVTYVYDEYKNYILINNNFEYKYQSYVQDSGYVYINDDQGNIYIVDKSNYKK